MDHRRGVDHRNRLRTSTFGRDTRVVTRRSSLVIASAAVAVVALTGGATLLVDQLRDDAERRTSPSSTDPSSDPTSPAPEGPTVPWALRLASQAAPTWDQRSAPESMAGCDSDDLRATAAAPEAVRTDPSQPPGLSVRVVVTNEGDPCRLPTEGDGELLDGDGDALRLTSSFGRTGVGRPTPPALETGAEASTVLSWGGHCGDDPGDWSIRLELGGDLPVEVPDTDLAVPACREGTDGAVYGFSEWIVLNGAGQPALDPQRALEASVTGPDEGRLGDVLPMVLRLANPTRGPIRLDPCPQLVWSVDRRGPGAFLRSSPTLELNCPAAPESIPAGGHVDFELELVLSSALADGQLVPGDWFIYPAIRDVQPRRIRVLPAAASGGTRACSWLPVPDADPRVPGLPPTTPRQDLRTATLHTNRGDLEVALAQEAPCATTAFAHLAEGGFWDGQPCYLLSATGTFRNVDCGSSDFAGRRAGFAFPAETRVGQDYPAGTVVLTFNESTTHLGSIRVLYGEAPTYADNFTILGHVTKGLDIVQEVAAGGQKDGEWHGPKLPLTITGVDLS